MERSERGRLGVFGRIFARLDETVRVLRAHHAAVTLICAETK